MGLAALQFDHRERFAGPTEAIPSRPEPLRSIRWIDEANSDETEAATAILDQATSLVERHPDSSAALARLAHAELAMARRTDAGRTARRALDLAVIQGDVSAIVAAALVLTAIGEAGSAEEALIGVGGRSFPALFARLAIERGDWNVALARLSDSTDAATLGLRGWVYLQLGRYAHAIKDLRLALLEGPPSPDLYINLGYAHGALGSLRKAISATRTAVSLSPANRTAAFNLVAFYSILGDKSAALHVLSGLQGHRPNELPVYLAVAEVYARFGDYVEAERELRKAKSERAAWAASPEDRAALKANLVAVECCLGKIAIDEGRRRIRRTLEDSEYRDLAIARIYAGWCKKTTDADDLESLLRELGRRHNSVNLTSFRVQLAFLRGDFDDALRGARVWAANDPFDAGAAATLTYLLVEVERAYDEAVREGQAALHRLPGNALLRNNVAYSLILGGRLSEARRIVSDPRTQEGHDVLVATRGLLALKEGNIDEGLALYETAASQAVAHGDENLAGLIRYRLAIEAFRVGVKTPFDLDELREQLDDDPRFHVLVRELGPA